MNIDVLDSLPKKCGSSSYILISCEKGFNRRQETVWNGQVCCDGKGYKKGEEVKFFLKDATEYKEYADVVIYAIKYYDILGIFEVITIDPEKELEGSLHFDGVDIL
jgi:hypothetical protein